MEPKDSPDLKISNNIRDLHSFKQLRKVKLDLESPKLQKACFNLGIQPNELLMKERTEFENKKLPKDVVDLRYKVSISHILSSLFGF